MNIFKNKCGDGEAPARLLSFSEGQFKRNEFIFDLYRNQPQTNFKIYKVSKEQKFTSITKD